MPASTRQKQIFKGDVDFRGVATSAVGVQTRPTAVIATADGLTTGLIPADAGYCEITSASLNNIARLPAGPAASVGMVVRGYVGANGCELRTPAASTATINNINCDDTNEAAIPATTLFECELVATNTWILTAKTELGADIAPIVPNVV